MTPKTRRFLVALAILAFFSFPVHAQNSLVFCLDVDSIGNPIDSGDAFSIPREGAPVNLLVSLREPVNTDTVQIDVYKKMTGTNVKYLTSFYIQVQKGQTNFITDYTFTKEGVYYFHFFGYLQKELVYGQVSIEYQKKY